MMKSFVLLSLLISLNAWSAVDIFDVPKPTTVMNQKYKTQDELNLQLSYLPVGAINKYAAVGGSYWKYLTPNHVWEILNFQYGIELEAQLKKDLKRPPFNAKDSDLPVLQFLATTNYIFSPFYSKSVLLNKSIVHSQLAFVGGGGIAQFSTETIPVADLGLSQRFFYGKNSSFKFDVRYYAFFTNKELLRNQMTLGLVYVWALGGQP
jgi:outer membrane beta-barrel protein